MNDVQTKPGLQTTNTNPSYIERLLVLVVEVVSCVSSPVGETNIDDDDGD
jgi:hypothetical protein